MTTKDEIQFAEKSIDAAWENMALPANSIDRCMFELLSFAEGRQAAAMMSHDPNVYLGVLNGVKFALREAFLLARKRLCLIVGGPYVPTRSGHELASRLLDSADAYNSATLAFSLYWQEEAECSKDALGVFRFRAVRNVGPYEMLDVLVTEKSEPGPLTMAMELLSKAGTKHRIVRVIGQSVKIDSMRRLQYQLNLQAALDLQQIISIKRTIMPRHWKAWGIEAGPLRAFLCALQTRCAYHMIAVNRGAAKFNIPSAGFDQLVLVCQENTLKNELALLSNTNVAIVDKLLTIFAYGEGTITPDPALQPIIKLANCTLAIPCHIVLSSNIERNALSLQTRTNKPEFNALSSHFEGVMIADAQAALASTVFVWRVGVSSSSGEIDILMGEVGSGTVLLLELKWSIQTADRGEVINRRKALDVGAGQARDKAEAVMANAQHYAELLELEVPAVTRVVRAVSFRGFADESSDKSVVCVPFGILTKLIQKASNIDWLIKSIQSQPWLPVAGVHYENIDSRHALGGVDFTWEGRSVTPAGLALGMEWSS